MSIIRLRGGDVYGGAYGGGAYGGGARGPGAPLLIAATQFVAAARVTPPRVDSSFELPEPGFPAMPRTAVTSA